MDTKKIKIAITGISTLAIMTTQAWAVGYNVKIDTRNDTLTNNGTIEAVQEVNGGLATQKAGLRVHSNAAVNYEYKSKNNTYTNNGTIKTTQKVSGGVATQAVGLEVN